VLFSFKSSKYADLVLKKNISYLLLMLKSVQKHLSQHLFEMEILEVFTDTFDQFNVLAE